MGRSVDSNVRIFGDPKSSRDAVLHAISQITPDVADADLWVRVANDPSYQPFHRAVAVYELFQRHVRKSMTLQQMASLFAGCQWLQDAFVERIELMGGEVPVQIPDGGEGIVIRLSKHSAATDPKVGVYLALDRRLEPNTLRDALMSRATAPSILETRIMDFALFPESLPQSDS
jgi:hypothetical protein